VGVEGRYFELAPKELCPRRVFIIAINHSAATILNIGIVILNIRANPPLFV